MLRRVIIAIVLLVVLAACSVLSQAPPLPSTTPANVDFSNPASPTAAPVLALATPTVEPTSTAAPDKPAIWMVDSSGNRWLAVDPLTGKTLNQVSRLLGLTTSRDGRRRYVLQAQRQDAQWRADLYIVDLTRGTSPGRIALINNIPHSSQVDRTLASSGVLLSRDERQLLATVSEFDGAQWVTRLFVVDLAAERVVQNITLFKSPIGREAPLTRVMLSSDPKRLVIIQSAQRQPRPSPEAQANWFTRIAVLNLDDSSMEHDLAVPGDIPAHGFGPDAVLSSDGQWLYLMQVFTRSANYAGYRFVAIDMLRYEIAQMQIVEKSIGGEEFSYYPFALTLTPDGRYLVGYNGDTRNVTREYFEFVDTHTGVVTQKVPLERHANSSAFDLSEVLLSPDKRLVHVAFTTSREVFALDLSRREIVGSAVLQDAKSVAPSAIERLTRALATWLVGTASAKVSPWPGATLSPDGQRLYLVGVKDGEHGEGVWAVETATLKTMGHWLSHYEIDGIRLGDDGRELYAASPSDNSLYMLDALNGESRRALRLDFTPSGFVTAQTY